MTIGRYIILLLIISLISPELSYTQAVGNGIRIDLSEKLSLDTDGGQFAQLFIPDYYQSGPDDGRYNLVIHLHSASWAAENHVYRAQANSVIFNIHLGAFSSPYQNYFSNQNVFQAILDTISNELERNQIESNPILKNLIMTSFSAGYAGLREILKQSAYYNQIQAIHLADGLHATSSAPIMEEQMQDFVRFARDARDNKKIMKLTHSSIPTPGYESTTSTANYLIEHIGSDRKLVNEQDEIGAMYSRCDTGWFNLRGYLGETANDHMQHLYAMHMMISSTMNIQDDSLTSIKKTQINPRNYRLEQNWPNPFNPSTRISYSLATRECVTLRLFNPIGQLIKTLYAGVQAPGKHRVELFAEGLPSGSYIYVLQSKGIKLSRKCLILK
jgi:hypothetical protein